MNPFSPLLLEMVNWESIPFSKSKGPVWVRRKKPSQEVYSPCSRCWRWYTKEGACPRVKITRYVLYCSADTFEDLAPMDISSILVELQRL